MYLNRREIVYDKSTVNIMLNDEKLKAFLLRSGKDMHTHSLVIFIQYSIRSPRQSS